MNTSFIAWACIVALFLIVFAVRFVKSLSFRMSSRAGHPFIELGSEHEEFFVPGDPDPKNDDEPTPVVSNDR